MISAFFGRFISELLLARHIILHYDSLLHRYWQYDSCIDNLLAVDYPPVCVGHDWWSFDWHCWDTLINTQ